MTEERKGIDMSPTETAPAAAPLKGYRTLIVNGALAIVPVALQYIAGVDWTQFVSPSIALTIVGAANLGLRLITSTPVAKSA